MLMDGKRSTLYLICLTKAECDFIHVGTFFLSLLYKGLQMILNFFLSSQKHNSNIPKILEIFSCL